jgi:rhamnulokinase
VPAKTTAGSGAPPDWCYLSSGTWSLLGVEVSRPVITADTARDNFTNEGGVAGTTRLLKNIMGLWLVQECRRTWARSGREYSYEELVAEAGSAKPYATLVDPDDTSFLAPGDMPARLAAFCRKTGQPEPDGVGGYVRCAMESLALKYRWAVERLERFVGTSIETIHVVGGGSRNGLLCQFTADACGRPVLAGPVEATAAGSLLVQAIAGGEVGSLADGRRILEQSVRPRRFAPRGRETWAEAARRYREIEQCGAA